MEVAIEASKRLTTGGLAALIQRLQLLKEELERRQ